MGGVREHLFGDVGREQRRALPVDLRGTARFLDADRGALREAAGERDLLGV